MISSLTIADLLAKDCVFQFAGEKPCINCNDVFGWGWADCENITEEALPAINQAVDDCNGDVELGAMLYCARVREERPQGAMYTYIPRKLWPLFHACGPERKVDPGNPYKPGEYKTKRKFIAVLRWWFIALVDRWKQRPI
jgi:hypothetical protein